MLKILRPFLFTVFIFFLTPAVGFSQYNFFKGYVVTNAGDTLKGFVLGKESSSNPTTLKYKTTLSAEVQQFSLSDCAAFGIEDKEYYERHTVKISLGGISFPDLSIGIDTASKVDTVFLKLLQKGENISLYSYSDLLKSRFYIKEKVVATPVELMYYNFYHSDDRGRIISNAKFQNQLYALFKKYQVEERFGDKLRRSRYGESDLIKMIALINHQVPVLSKHSPVRFFVGAGAIVSNASYAGNHIFASESVKATSSLAPYFNIGIDIFANPVFRKSVFRVELSTFSSTNEFSFHDPVSSYSGYHNLKQHNAVLSAQMLHHVYNGTNQKVFIGGGFSGNFTLSSKSVVNYQNSPVGLNVIPGPMPAKFHFSIPLILGLSIKNKIELSCAYSVKSKITNYTTFSIRQERFRLGMSYLFSKKIR